MAYQHITTAERDIIAKQLNNGASYRKIAKLINRSHTSIAREVRRQRKIYTSPYNPKTAQLIAECWRMSARHAKCKNNKKLYKHVIERLKQGDSPDIIAGRLKTLFPDNTGMRISHETIYRWIYQNRLQGGQQYKYLLRKHQRRIPRGRRGTKGGTLKGRISIHKRHADIETRKHPSHWEGDLIVGKQSSGYFVTLTERKSRLTLAKKINTKHADVVAKTIIQLLKPYQEKVSSITFDNGREFYGFKQIAKAIKTNIYFADPYSSWQRGSNENANGMIRRYFPKKSNFSKITHRQVKKVIDKINNRPRKILNYQTANEVFLAA
jgi:IS30 family transposase